MKKRWTKTQVAAIKAKAQKAAEDAEKAISIAKTFAREAAVAQKSLAAAEALKVAKAESKAAGTRAITKGKQTAAQKAANKKLREDAGRGELGKKWAVRALEEIEWRQQFFQFAANRIDGRKGTLLKAAKNFCRSVAIAELTGLRPEELQKGVSYALNQSGEIWIGIKGAKILHDDDGKRVRGIEDRILVISNDTPAFDWLRHEVLETAQANNAKFNDKNFLPSVCWKWKKGTFKTQCARVLDKFIKTDAFKAWPPSKQQVFKDFFSPYLYRSSFAFELIDSELPASIISACMGHRLTDSIQSYARARGRKTLSPVANVIIGKNDQVICHQTKVVLFDSTGFKAEGQRPEWSPSQTKKPSTNFNL